MSSNEEPHGIAIAGYACRLPGAASPTQFWRALKDGRSAIGKITDDRWPVERYMHPSRSFRGRSYTAAAGLVDGIWDFDPAFFGLSPREAEQMDPQQRMLLMVAWEALESANLPPERLDSAGTGVFIGASGTEYGSYFYADYDRVDAQCMTGNTLSIVSNRISHLLDLQGPSYTVDTACSSSFFALDHAVTALQAGRIETAIVGGSNTLLAALPFVGFSRASMLSQAGALRAFDAEADGYVRGEGVVCFVLKRLADAERSGDRVRAVICGTGTNTNGRNVGLTRPSAARQAQLMASVAETFTEADGIAFVEAHGTGTPVGDPEEAEAIGTAFGRSRSAPLPIGSVKTNIGHLEPASGVAGLLKAVLALEHNQFPPSLNFETPNPNIDFETLNLSVATSNVDLGARPGGAPWYAAVNSFGYGGANATAVLRQYKGNTQSAVDEPAKALILSAASKDSLAQQVANWRARLAEADAEETQRLIGTAAHRRSRLQHRAIILPGRGETISDRIKRDSEIVFGETMARGSKTAFVFSGNGSQYVGMGDHLYESDPQYRRAFDEVCDLFLEIDPEQNIRAWLASPDIDETITNATRAQPILFALQVGLVTSLAHEGLSPDGVVGHSVGEACASWCAGAIPLRQAVQIIATRAPLVSALHGMGTMAAVLTDAATADAILEETGLSDVVVSADNSPRSTTISGPEASIAEFDKAARKRRVAVKQLDIPYPYHSPALDKLHEAFFSTMGEVTPRETPILYASATTGGLIGGDELNLDYWWRNLREPVRFRPAISALNAADFGLFLEIGPRPVLRSYVTDTLKSEGRNASVMPTLEQRAKAAPKSAKTMVAAALANGAKIDDAVFFGPPPKSTAELPAYPWDLEPYRVGAKPAELDPMDAPTHPFLGVAWSGSGTEWRSIIDLELYPWLADHKVDGAAVLPASAYIDMALAAGREVFDDTPHEVVDLDFVAKMVLTADRSLEVRTVYERESHILTIESRTHLNDPDWHLHARGTLRPAAMFEIAQPEAPIAPEFTLDAGRLYAALAGLGLDYGPAFRLAQSTAVKGGRAHVTLAQDAPAELARTLIDPLRLDAGFHGIFAVLAEAASAVGNACSMVPVHAGQVRVVAPGKLPATAGISVTQASTNGAKATVVLLDREGAPTAVVEGLRLQSIPRAVPSVHPKLWTEETVPVAPPADGLPLEIDALVAAGALSREAPSRSASALVLDTLARRTIWDMLSDRGTATSTSDPLSSRLRTVLDEDGATSSLGDAAACPYPTVAELVEVFLEIAPGNAGHLRQVQHALASLEAECTGAPKPAPLPAELNRADPDRQRAFHAAKECLARLAGQAVPDRRYNVLILGTPEVHEVEALATSSRISLLTVSDPDDDRLNLLRRAEMQAPNVRIGTFEEITGAQSHDALLIFPSARELAAETCATAVAALTVGAPIVSIVAEPTLLRELTNSGQSQTWQTFSEGTSAAATVTDWKASLAAAGAKDVQSAYAIDAAEPIAVVAAVSAALPQAAAEAPETRSLSIRHLGDRCVQPALAEALSAAGLNVLTPTGIADEVLLVADLSDTEAPSASMLAGLIDLLRNSIAPTPKRLWIAASSDARHEMTTAGLRAAARVAANEYPETEFRFLETSNDAAGLARLVAAIGAPQPDRELSLRHECHSAPRLTGLPLPGVGAAGGEAEDRRMVLAQHRRGDLSTLHWEPARRQAPEPGEIEIQVEATGLNFRDVMWAQGLLPSEALEDGYAGATLGMECAGKVVRAAEGARFAVGDQVIALAAHAFASHVTIPETAAAPLPAGLSAAAGAALPVAFITAQYALVEVARLRATDTVLIHGGAGGVGLAALQVAKAVGAKVYATAGSLDKRALLRSLGADAVFNSRSLDFVDEIKALGGVDVVLNSLSGDAMERSIEVLRPFGRFIELGKRDFYGNSRMALRPFRRNVSYSGVDVDQLVGAHAETAGRVFADVVAGFDSGQYRPLPFCTLPAADIVSAMRLMQKSGHIGKVTVAAPEVAMPAVAATKPLGRGAWLVTGGTAGFGLSTALWLARQGVARLWLTSRSGHVSPQDQPGVDALRANGVAVQIGAADAADADAMAAVFAQIEAAGPLEGIVHAAAVIEDMLLDKEDPVRMATVIRPKLDGALVLDRLSRPLNPAHFVLYSSIAARFGNPGQAAYSAANAALDALAAQRRTEGLPALSVGWTPIADAGYLDKADQLRDQIARKLGGALMTAETALELLGAFLRSDDVPPSVGLGPMPWSRIAPELPLLATPYAERLPVGPNPSDSTGNDDLLAELQTLPQSKALDRLLKHLVDEMAQILRQPVSEIDPYRPLDDLGVDSLMAMDLKLTLEERLGVTVPILKISDGMSLADLSLRLLDKLRGDAETMPKTASEKALHTLMERHLAQDDGSLDPAVLGRIAGADADTKGA